MFRSEYLRIFAVHSFHSAQPDCGTTYANLEVFMIELIAFSAIDVQWRRADMSDNENI